VTSCYRDIVSPKEHSVNDSLLGYTSYDINI